MPDRLRAAFNPPRLGGYRSKGYRSGADFIVNYELAITPFRAACKVCAQAREAEQTPGGNPFVLDFLVLFDQAKRTKVRAESPLDNVCSTKFLL